MIKTKDNGRFAGTIAPALLIAVFGMAGCASNQTKETAQVAPAAVEPAPVAATPAVEPKPVCDEKKPAKGKEKKSGKGKATAPADCVPAAAPAAAARESAPPPAAAATAGGYDLSKNRPVTDSTKVEAGQGTLVKGINDWQGEVSGVPAANSRFTRLRIGMPQQQVVDLVGQPTDQGAYVTGKAFIPFYFGSDKTRWEMVYKGQGRLIFSNQSGFGTGYYLTWIIHNANEGGYR